MLMIMLRILNDIKHILEKYNYSILCLTENLTSQIGDNINLGVKQLCCA